MESRMMNKPARLLDPSFRYTPAAHTTPDYLRGRMKKWRERIEAEKKKDDVIPLTRRKP
jgi:hypothetical protein